MASTRRRLSEPLRRAARTFIQAFLSTFIALVTTGQFTEKVGNATVPNWDQLDTLLLACGTAGVVSLGTWLYNAVEGWLGKDILINK